MKTYRAETMIGMPASESLMSSKQQTTCAIPGGISILRGSLSHSASLATVEVEGALMTVTARGILSIESMKWMTLAAPPNLSASSRLRLNARRNRMVC